MEVGVRELRNRTAEVIAAVESGERVILSVNGSDCRHRSPWATSRWLSGDVLSRELRSRAADPSLATELDELAGRTLDEDGDFERIAAAHPPLVVERV